MSALSIQPTYPIFTDIDGQPLEDGYVWIGAANLDPQTNPINVYWDSALTLPAAQPIRTLAGYPANSGTPARLYVNSDYSIRVMDKNGSMVYSAPAATERYGNIITAATIGFSHATAYPQGTVGNALQLAVNVKNAPFNAVGDGVADDTAAFQAAVNFVGTNGTIYIPDGRYNISDQITVDAGNKVSFVGAGKASTFLVSTLSVTDNSKSVIKYDGTVSSLCSDVTISGFTIEAYNFGKGIEAVYCFPKLTIRDVNVFKPRQYGIYLEECWTASLYDCDVDGDNQTSLYGFYIVNANNVVLYNPRVYNMLKSGQSTGIGATSAENFSIFGGNVENCPRGIYVVVGGVFDGPVSIHDVYFEPRNMQAFDAGQPNDHIKILGDTSGNGSVTVQGCLFQAGSASVPIAFNGVSAQNLGSLNMIGNVWQKAKYTTGGEGENYFIDVDATVKRVNEIGNTLISTSLGNLRQIPSTVVAVQMNSQDSGTTVSVVENLSTGDEVLFYDEVSFTPTIAGGDYTFPLDRAKGTCTRIGNRVFVDLSIYINPVSAPSGSTDGDVSIGGLPFVFNKVNDNDPAGGIINYKQNLLNASQQLSIRMDDGTATFKIYKTLATAFPDVGNFVKASDFVANSRIRISFNYTTTA